MLPRRPPSGSRRRRGAGDAHAAPRRAGSSRGREGQRPAAAGCSDDEADLLLGLLTSLRDRIPPELQQRLAEAVREVLLALRALIDWYLERTERRAAEPAEVQDIPIL